MLSAVRSYVAGMRAAAKLGRAFKLRRKGSKAQAMAAARAALGILAAPHVRRASPAEGAALVGATVLVEQIAEELNVAGAGPRDIADAVAYLKVAGVGTEYEPWIPYLEGRLAKGGACAA